MGQEQDGEDCRSHELYGDRRRELRADAQGGLGENQKQRETVVPLPEKMELWKAVYGVFPFVFDSSGSSMCGNANNDLVYY